MPLSTSFAGEFLILAGVFDQGWAWAAIGAGAMVLAAMYALRLVSAVLHRDVGSAVPDSALDLRLGELAVVVPLVLCLLGLSRLAEPGLRSRVRRQPRNGADHRASGSTVGRIDGACAEVISKPHVDWFALSPSLALLAAAGAAADGRGLRAAHARVRRSPPSVAFAGFVASLVWAVLLDDKSPHADDRSCTTRCSATAGRRSPRC